MENTAITADLAAKRDTARQAVADFNGVLTNPSRTSRDLGAALVSLRRSREQLGAHWPVIRGWTQLLIHRGDVSEGEIYDMMKLAGFVPRLAETRIAQLDLHLAAAVWPGLSTFLGEPAVEGIEQHWFDEWLALHAQARGNEDMLEDCDALLELMARLFGMSHNGAIPASAAWVGALHEQAAAYALQERGLDDPERPLVTPSRDIADRASAHALVASLGAVYSEALASPNQPARQLAAQLAGRPAYLRSVTGALELRKGEEYDGPAAAARRPEWIELLLGFWAADNAVVAALLEKRSLIRLNARRVLEPRPIIWVDGQEQRIALIGPSGAGKTSLMLASSELAGVPKVTVYHALGPAGDGEVKELWADWLNGEAKNTEQESFIARTAVENLCSFSFIDISGESYFPQSPDRLQSLEVIRLRYARRPPAVVMLMLNGGRPREMVAGKKLDDALDVIRNSPPESKATPGSRPRIAWPEEEIDNQALNHSRPVYLLVSHVDTLIGNVLADRDDALARGMRPGKDLVDRLEKALTDHVLRFEELGLEPTRGGEAAARTILMRDAELLRSPSLLRLVLDSLGIFYGPAQSCAAANLDNLHLHFLRSGGGKPPVTLGVEALWKHLWTKTRPASTGARKAALKLRLATLIETEFKKVADRVVAFDDIELPRLTRAAFQAGAEAVNLASMKKEVLESFRRPDGGLQNLLGDGAAHSIFDGRFGAEYKNLVGPYDENLTRLNDKIEAATLSVLDLMGIPADETFAEFNRKRSLISGEQNLKRLQGWRQQYLSAVPGPAPVAPTGDIDEARQLLNGLGKADTTRQAGRQLLERLLEEHQNIEEARRETVRTQSMFHALRGALNDSCVWRNMPINPDKAIEDGWAGAESWIKNHPALCMSEALYTNFAKTVAQSEDDWVSRIGPAIRLLTGYRPLLPTLHVNLLETDQAKIRSVEETYARLDVRERGLDALNAIRNLAVVVRGGVPLATRLRAIATLAALGPLLRSLSIDPDKLASEPANAVTAFNSAQTELDLVDVKWRSRNLFDFTRPNPDLLKAMSGSLDKVRNQLADYAANGGQPVGGEAGASRDATQRAMRTVDLALWVARNIEEAPFSAQFSDSGTDLYDAFSREIQAVSVSINNCKVALQRFYDTLRNAILHERYLYLVEAGLLVGENAVANNLAEVFADRDHGSELPLDSKEARYKQVVKTLLSRLDTA
ncbi:hypothetical protein HNR00_004994 [Methylorubrum rhodinum]|uniref:Uncharacterized protein n=1 Tax=Methylorubrum rhodinum TaxID=29428 RepID=A0A840ZT77_9HYPH|nr:hypothetical protein [Methylorubrum rhodinum]MBB5760245.1 hypothetical protein [Methylorubrum rhodinum]